MSTESMPTFAVILADTSEVPAGKFADALAAFRKIPFQDAAHEVRLAWGFAGQNLSNADADQLTQVMKSNGISARAVPMASIVDLPALQSVRAVAPVETGFTITLMSGENVAGSYSDIRVICAAAVPVHSVVHTKMTEGRTNVEKIMTAGLLLSGIPMTVGKGKRVVEKTVVKDELVFVLDVLLRNPDRRFRVNAEGLNFSFLKERMLHNNLQNFKTMLIDFSRFAPAAHINRGARMFMKNQLVTQMGYDSLHDLEKETLWLSLL